MSDVRYDVDLDQNVRQQAIDEYMNTRYIDHEEGIKRWNRKIYAIAGGGYFAIVVFVSAVFMIKGSLEDGLIAFGVMTLLILVSVLMMYLIFRIGSRNVRKENERRAREDLEKMRYYIEDGYLKREHEGDRRRNRKFDLSKIHYVTKEGYVLSFDYKNETVELLDFYDPPLYDSLKELAGRKPEAQKAQTEIKAQ